MSDESIEREQLRKALLQHWPLLTTAILSETFPTDASPGPFIQSAIAQDGPDKARFVAIFDCLERNAKETTLHRDQIQSELTKRVEEYEADLIRATRRISDFDQVIATQTEELLETRAKITGLNAEITRLNSCVTQHNERISTLQDEKTELQTRLAQATTANGPPIHFGTTPKARRTTTNPDKFTAGQQDTAKRQSAYERWKTQVEQILVVDAECFPKALDILTFITKMVKTVLSMVHDQKHHFGVDRMLYDLRGVSMVNKTRQVRKFAQHCPQCNVVSTDRQPPIGTLQPIRPADTLPMRVIGIDFIVGLPTVPSEGSPWQLKGKDSFDSLLTVSCKSSKRTLLIPGHTTYTAQQWGQVLMRQLFLSDWGVPSAIISDRDRKFTSEFWQGMWESLGTKLLMTAAYHPQSDGLAERKNQTVEIAMRFFVFERPEANWTDLITPLQWNLNSSYSAPIQSSPHEQLFGFKLPGPFEALAIPPSVESDIPSMRESLREERQINGSASPLTASTSKSGSEKPR